MREIFTSDVTIKKCVEAGDINLTFKGKIEIANILDRIGVSSIELPMIEDKVADSLLIKSIAGALENSTLTVKTDIYQDNISLTWQALKEAAKPRLQIVAPVSPARMEYDYHKKPEAMLEAITKAVSFAKTLCDDVEFVANDATRADGAFLREVLNAAIQAGANHVGISDTAGVMLPEEMYEFTSKITKDIPQLLSDDICFAVSCCDELHMADACALSAIRAGANEIKTSVYPINKVSLEGIAKILAAKGDEFDAFAQVRTTELKKAFGELEALFEETADNSPFTNEIPDRPNVELSADIDFDGLMSIVSKLGYDLNETDKVKVWESFKNIIQKKKIGAKELDAIVASDSLQVPEEYLLDSYMVTTGNVTDVVAHVKLNKDGEMLDGVSLGNGPIDAAFLAIEKITGRHFELDDFQIQSITEGREAVGQSIIKLREHGKIYAGRGTSTDIVGAAVAAYINALNKIVYEENNQ